VRIVSHVWISIRKVWKMVADTKNGEWFMRLAASLGLRRPSEPTRRTLGLMILCAQHGIEHVRNTSPRDRQAFVASIKQPFKRIADSSGPPATWLWELPSGPPELLMKHPELYEATYTDAGPPAPNPFPSTTWEPLLAGTKCRRDRNDMSSLSMGSFGGGPDGSAKGMMEAYMQRQLMMMQQMQQTFQMMSTAKGLPNLTFPGGSPHSEIAFSLPDSRGRPSSQGTLALCPPALEAGAAPPGTPDREGLGHLGGGVGSSGAVAAAAPSIKVVASGAAPPATDVPPDTKEEEMGPPAQKKARLSVADATTFILGQMSDKKAAKKEAADKAATKPGKGGGMGRGKGGGKGGAKKEHGKPFHAKACYRFDVQEHHVQCFYCKLPCAKFPFANKKEKVDAVKAAEARHRKFQLPTKHAHIQNIQITTLYEQYTIEAWCKKKCEEKGLVYER